MKTAAFQELLASVRDAGTYLRGNRLGVARTDNNISPRVARRHVSPAKDKRKISAGH